MKAHFASLNEREQWMVIAAVLCVVIYTYYFLFYSPLSTRVIAKESQLIEKSQTLQWMKSVRGQSPKTKSKKSLDNNQLLTLISDQLKNSALVKFPYKLQQTGAGEIQLSFEEVPFNLFIIWLFKINKSYAMTIKQFDAEETPTVGVSKLMIIVSA